MTENRTWPIVIAEAGVNHNGSLDYAMRLVDIAAEAKADYVKFQTFKTENLVAKSCPTAAYQQEKTGHGGQYEMLKNLELSYNDFRELKNYCEHRGIGFLSTPFDIESVDFLASLKVDFMKIPSGEITNLPYLRRIASTGIPVIISTGMSTIDEIGDALRPFRNTGYAADKIFLLHCNTQYPTPYQDVNLNALTTLEKAFGVEVGYSDHTVGVEVPVAAVALGAKIIEKHFTMSRELEGPDHSASLEPEELKMMVSMIRNVNTALGSPEKFRTSSETGNLGIARKSIVASRKIVRGQIIQEEDLTTKRPGTGLSPMIWDRVVGSVATKDFMPDQQIEL